MKPPLALGLPLPPSIASRSGRLSAPRVGPRHFTAPSVEFYGREPINLVPEILAEPDPCFTVETRTFSPLPFLPFVFSSLVIGLRLIPRAAPRENPPR